MSPHLCQLAGDWAGEVPAGGLMVECKHNGWRLLRFAGIDGKTRLWSRQGMPLEGLDHIARYLDRIEEAAGLPMMFDGELIVDGSLAGTKAYCERGWRAGNERGHLWLFDAMPLTEWKAGGCDLPLYQRKARLAALVAQVEAEGLPWEWRPGSKGADEGPAPMTLVADEWATDAADVLDAAKRIWAAGGEGIVAKLAEAPYERRRSSAWMKCKADNRHKWMRAVGYPIAA